ncbi:MAG: hypothetical protein BWY75_01977 [bacterium ADurb.Bin425]|nr:MAG: hypothetical protein BWY75_01977 [bacterium ADurb.Bin425]
MLFDRLQDSIYALRCIALTLQTVLGGNGTVYMVGEEVGIDTGGRREGELN